MKIYSAHALRDIDQYTIEKESITSLDLIERAASTIVYEIVSRYPRNKHICIFAGPGNNGGDALAVARLLIIEGYNPEIFLFNTASKLSEGCNASLQRLRNECPTAQLDEIIKTFRPPHLTANTLVIDGLFGTGLNKPIVGGFTSLVEYINDSEAYVISIDIPSGLMCEWTQKNDPRHIIKAHITYTFQYPKLSFFFRENAQYIGQWKVLDIGLKTEPTLEAMSQYYCIESSDVVNLLRPRDKFADKFANGHGLLISGRYGMVGAAVLASQAAMRSGIGLTTVHAPRCANIILQTAVPEALFDPDADDLVCSEIKPSDKFNAIGIGPGLGHGIKQTSLIRNLLAQGIKQPMVLDADALRILARHQDLIELIPSGTIITPHVGEFEGLFECIINSDSHRLQQAIANANRYNIIIVLKGAYTAVVSPRGEVYFNTSGNNGMGTAGSGDVLTGIITSLLAQGYEPLKAAVLAVHLHGLAGDIAIADNCEEFITAQDIVANIGKAFRKLRNNDK